MFRELRVAGLMACVVVGGGVVGLAIARRLARRGPVFLVEQQRWLAQEQSSRNSEVPAAPIGEFRVETSVIESA